MGMAASQARYIELTARKTNVEYEGQQINQQRTALANESSGMFNQLMTLQVPTAPSSSNFTTTQYTFSDGTQNYTISDITPTTSSATTNALVTYYYTDTPYTGIEKDKSQFKVTNSSGTYWVGTTSNPQQTKLTDYNATNDKAAVDQIISTITDKPAASRTSAESAFLTDSATLTNIKSYSAGGTTYYVDVIDPNNATGSTLATFYAANISKKEVTTNEPAYLKTESSGRYSDITLSSSPTTTFDLTATTTVDQTAYNDAVNEYEYQQQAYQQQVNNINAKTEVIEQEDRTLEMKLKQLDTEQEALQTEMESVKKVIDKNIEQTFKTFSS